MGIKNRLIIMNFFTVFYLGSLVNHNWNLLFQCQRMDRRTIWGYFLNIGTFFIIYACINRYYCRQMDECRKTLWFITNLLWYCIIFCSSSERSKYTLLCYFSCNDILYANNIFSKFHLLQYFKE